MMPLGALLMCIMISTELGVDQIAEEVTAGPGHKFTTRAMFTVCCKYIAPIILAFVLYNQLKDFGLLATLF